VLLFKDGCFDFLFRRGWVSWGGLRRIRLLMLELLKLKILGELGWRRWLIPRNGLISVIEKVRVG